MIMNYNLINVKEFKQANTEFQHQNNICKIDFLILLL